MKKCLIEYTQYSLTRKLEMKILLFLLFPVLVSGCGFKDSSPLPTVPSVSLARYTGTWYEIARYENRFERGCVGASAAYHQEEEYIQVTNSCFDANGVLIDQAQGKAYPVEGSNGAKLRVTFFWPFFGDYWILMLADDYRYSVVGDPGRQYLWILSRTSELSHEDKTLILKTLPELGYDPARLYWTELRLRRGK